MSKKIIGHCGAPGCGGPIFVDEPHECPGVRAYRLAEAAGKDTFARFVFMVSRGVDPDIAAELVKAGE